MNSLYLAKTAKTPEITFDPRSEIFEIVGRSIPENSFEFYKPVMEWLDAYQKEANGYFHLVVKLEYFNTSSSKCLIDIFRKLEKLHNNSSQVLIKWYFAEEDEDMRESGEDFKDILKVPLEMVAYSSEDDL